MKHVIIGNSAAGIGAAERIREMAPGDGITLISDERYPAYSRVLTPYYLAGAIPLRRLFLYGAGTYRSLGIEALLGRRAVAVHPREKTVVLEDGGEVGYDRLLLATGAGPVIPRIPGIGARRVFALRTLDDARGIRERARTARVAVVVGGGFVGVKAACALRGLGLEVSMVVSSGHLLSQVLDRQVAGLVEDKMCGLGIRLHFGEQVEAIVEGRGGVRGVVGSGGSRWSCRLVVFGKGVEPNIGFLRESGLHVDRGILVDRFMATNLEGVFAAGDAAQAYDAARGVPAVNAVWPNAVEQGRVAGANMAGGRVGYQGSMAMNALRIDGLTLVSLGLAGARGEGMGVVERRDARTYRRAVVQDGRLIGATFVNDVRGAGLAYHYIRSGLPLPQAPEFLACGFSGVLSRLAR